MMTVMYGGMPTDWGPNDFGPIPIWDPAVPTIPNPFGPRVARADEQNQDPEGDASILAATVAKLEARRKTIEVELERAEALRRELDTILRVLAAYAPPVIPTTPTPGPKPRPPFRAKR